MSDRHPRPLGRLSDEELGAALRSVAPDIWPATPPVAENVTSLLEAAPTKTLGSTRARMWAAAAILTALLVGPFFFSPTLREAAASFFGLPGVEIEVTEGSPHADLSPPDLGVETDLASVQAAVSFEIRVPEILGAPDEVFLDRSSGESVVSLAYEPRADLPEASETGLGLLVMEFEGTTPPALIKKIAGGGSSLQLVDLDGRTAYWVSGAPHPLLYRDPQGSVRESTARLAANTLLFSEGGVTFRIEGDITLERALSIARSL